MRSDQGTGCPLERRHSRQRAGGIPWAGVEYVQGAAERWRLEWEPGMSRGEAAGALTVAFAAQALEPATPRQRAALWRRGVQVPSHLTKRQASRLLSAGGASGQRPLSR